MIDYSKFRSSPNPAFSYLDREAVAESVIQRFETCYDRLWKVLNRYLAEALAAVETPNSLKPIFRQVHENRQLAVPAARWFRYAEARVDTSHDYDGENWTMSGATWE